MSNPSKLLLYDDYSVQSIILSDAVEQAIEQQMLDTMRMLLSGLVDENFDGKEVETLLDMDIEAVKILRGYSGIVAVKEEVK